MQASLDFGDELFGASPEDQSAGLGFRAAFEEIESLSSNLPLLEALTSPQMFWSNVGACRRDATSCGLNHAFQVVRRHSSSTEDVSIGEISSQESANVVHVQCAAKRHSLCSKVANGQLAEYDLRTRSIQCFHFVVDDLPFGIDNRLVF